MGRETVLDVWHKKFGGGVESTEPKERFSKRIASRAFCSAAKRCSCLPACR